MKTARSGVLVITGGTGSLGTALTRFALARKDVQRVRIVSRDELKQHEMAKEFKDDRLRFFIGDVRDLPRMQSALHGADWVVHAAAMKQVPACEYNPYEAVQTNIIGTQNVLTAAIDQNVQKAILVSTDKAVDPINHYGSTKKVAENLWLYANTHDTTQFSLTRWGNVMSSRGSVIPLFREQKDSGVLTVTHPEMTRFLISIDDAVAFLWKSLETMRGGEQFTPNLKSAWVIDIADVIAPGAEIQITGVRQGEKLHETLGPDYWSNDPDRLMQKAELRKLLNEST